MVGCLGCHWGCCWVTDWGQQWDPRKEMNLGSPMVHYWECQWDRHSAPLRGW